MLGLLRPALPILLLVELSTSPRVAHFPSASIYEESGPKVLAIDGATRQSSTPSSAVPTQPSAPAASALPPSDRSSPADGTDKVRLPRCRQIAVMGPEFEPLAETCDFALNSTGTLPDFIAQETIKRFARATDNFRWQDVDVATAEVRFESGKVERYSDFRRNGEAFPIPPDVSSIELGEFLTTKTGGMWSLAVFGGQLRFVFAPTTDAKFTYAGTTRIDKAAGATFRFRAEALPYGWTVTLLGKRIQIPTEGSIWIDARDSRHMRFDLHNPDVAEGSAAFSININNEYGPVSIRDVGVFQLPVKNETESCTAKTKQCYRDISKFQNYRKFGAQSHILEK